MSSKRQLKRLIKKEQVKLMEKFVSAEKQCVVSHENEVFIEMNKDADESEEIMSYDKSNSGIDSDRSSLTQN